MARQEVVENGGDLPSPKERCKKKQTRDRSRWLEMASDKRVKHGSASNGDRVGLIAGELIRLRPTTARQVDVGRRALAKKERTLDGSGGVWMVPDGLGGLAPDPSEIYILVLQ